MPYTILIIDDDEATHEVLGTYLAFSGYRVLGARDGRKGLSMLRTEKPDLALLDIQMPELDGFQTLAEARRDVVTAAIPILLLTSLDRHNLKVRGLEMGADDYIVKPFHQGEILARIKSTLRRCSRYQRIDGTLQGDLASVTLTELLQTLEIGRKTVLISLPDLPGTLFMEDGALVRVEQGKSTGRGALLRILYLERGRFEASFGPVPADLAREEVATRYLLLDCLSYLDELTCVIAGCCRSTDTVLEVSQGSGLGGAEVERLLPLPVRDFLCLHDGELKELAQLLVQAVAAGTVRLKRLAG